MVGAWMPGNYHDGNDYTVAEQVAFAGFMTQRLNDRIRNQWIPEMQPVFDSIYG